MGVILFFLIAFAVAWVCIDWDYSLPDKTKSTDSNTSGKTETVTRREPLSETAIEQYTAGMEEAYDKILHDRYYVYPGVPWGAVYYPDRMRDILRSSTDPFINTLNYDWYLEGVGRFKLSVQAYAKYGIAPTRELIDYMEKHGMNPDLDESAAWFRKVHR